MKASRLIFTLLLASSVAVVQLAAQQTKADQKPIGEVKAKAEAGDAESEVELGRRYDKGEGVVKDQRRPRSGFAKPPTESRRGAIQFRPRLLRTEGVAKDQAEAVKWYRKAAEQNLARAQYNLGVCYADGEGVAKDQVEAVKWYRKAAEQNLAKAQYNLGVCYERGAAAATAWRRMRWRR